MVKQQHFPLSDWLGYFFHYALTRNKNFYWAWDQFMIVVRHYKKKRFLVLEIPIPQEPFLIQKHVDITAIPPDVLVQSLLFLFHHYNSSPLLRRNREPSVRFLSFLSFLQLLADNKIKIPEHWDANASMNRFLVAYLMKTLDDAGIMTHKQKCFPPLSLFQLLSLQSKVMKS